MINDHIRSILENADKEHINCGFIFNKKIVLVVPESLSQNGDDLFTTLKCPLVVVSSTNLDF